MKTTGSAFTTWNVKTFSDPPGPRLARGPDRPPTTQPGDSDPASDSTERHLPAIYCRACRNSVSGQQYRIAMAGRHGHRVINPHGTEFVIGCFSRADGCLAAGHPYRRHSWFPGHQWQIALCRQCGSHLGWHFSQADENSFYALIFDRITD